MSIILVSYYKNESMRTIVSFVDFCELLGMNSSKMSAEKMQEAVIIFSKVSFTCDSLRLYVLYIRYLPTDAKSCTLSLFPRNLCACRPDTKF
jgi:hypothetical protein